MDLRSKLREDCSLGLQSDSDFFSFDHAPLDFQSTLSGGNLNDDIPANSTMEVTLTPNRWTWKSLSKTWTGHLDTGSKFTSKSWYTVRLVLNQNAEKQPNHVEQDYGLCKICFIRNLHKQN